MSTRDLIPLLGDPLAHDDPALATDPARDRALMIEAPGEATAIWNHKARTALVAKKVARLDPSERAAVLAAAARLLAEGAGEIDRIGPSPRPRTSPGA